ncbi:unnamed protein product, partial [Rotaria sp. Silwood1]
DLVERLDECEYSFIVIRYKAAQD